MKYIKTYEDASRVVRWLVNIDKYCEASLRKIGMDNEESARWVYNFTHDVSRPNSNRIIVIKRNDFFYWDNAPDKLREVKLTSKEKNAYDIEIDSKKYNV